MEIFQDKFVSTLHSLLKKVANERIDDVNEQLQILINKYGII